MKTLLTIALVMAGWLSGPARAEANPELRRQFNKMAGVVSGWVKEQGGQAITLGPIAGPPSVDPAAGLRVMLAEELSRHKVKTAFKANLGLVGNYHAVTGDKDRPLAVKFSLAMVDANNQTLKQWSFTLRENSEVAFLLGLTTHTPPNADPRAVNRQMERDREKPPGRNQGGTLLVGPYGIEILVADEPRTVDIRQNPPVVALRKGDIYTIRLVNQSDHEVAVWLAIDGISVFAFNEDPAAEGKRRDYQVLVPPRGTTLVKGWYRRRGQSDAFLVTDYPPSAAALKKRTAKVGMITAQFRACWEKEGKPPADEILERGVATGFGPLVSQRWQVRERTFGAHRATITLRYSKQ